MYDRCLTTFLYFRGFSTKVGIGNAIEGGNENYEILPTYCIDLIGGYFGDMIMTV